MNADLQPGTCNSGQHLSRRSLLKGTVVTASGMAVANWGALFNSQTIAAEAPKDEQNFVDRENSRDFTSAVDWHE